MLVFAQSILAFALLKAVRPLESRRQANVEAFNEVTMLVSIYTMMCFSPKVMNATVKARIGYFACFVIAAHFTISLVLITDSSIRETIRSCKLSQAKRYLNKQRVQLKRKLAKAKALRGYKR